MVFLELFVWEGFLNCMDWVVSINFRNHICPLLSTQLLIFFFKYYQIGKKTGFKKKLKSSKETVKEPKARKLRFVFNGIK